MDFYIKAISLYSLTGIWLDTAAQKKVTVGGKEKLS